MPTLPDITPRPSILVVDDSWYMHALVRDALEPLGCPVECVSDATEALGACRRERFGVVLMDVVLPDQDGVTAARRIRELDPSTRVLLVSGLLDDTVRMAARQAGVTAFVAKPFTGRELLGAVRSALGPDAAGMVIAGDGCPVLRLSAA